MSNEEKDIDNPYNHYDPFNYNHHHEMDRSCFQFFNDNNSSGLVQNHHHPQNLQAAGFDMPSSYMSFTDCLHGSMDYGVLSRAFDMSCSSSEVISQIDDASKKASAGGVGESVGTSAENPSTPNSSISSSSNEAAAAAEEDSVKSKKDKQPKGSEEGDEEDKSKKAYVSFPVFSYRFSGN